MNGRDEILRTMLSRNVTPDEFNFDRMTAPPVEYFLSPQDIQDLIYLANSIKFNAKIQYKYDQIDKILKNRGFVLLGRGTNRVVYRYLENNTICLKVAIDHVGCTDNPKEFINQEYLKPFVSKIFNYDPSGTIAVAERVHPISTREEFMHYAEGIYDLITKWFIGKYVVNDIGTKFFMNWGIRYSTGLPVLLDYPYFYLLDIRKAKCMSILEDGTICGGDIDYDDGYNFLKCTKCGRNYKAAELAKDDLRGARSIVKEAYKNMKTVVTVKRGNEEKKITINPETKTLENQYKQVAKISTRVIKEVIDNKAEEEKANRSINRLSETANIERSENKFKVQSKKSKMSIVVNEENKGLKKDAYDTEGHFKPDKKSGKKTVKKVRVNPLANKKADKYTETKAADFDLGYIHVSTNKKENTIEVPEEVVEEVKDNTPEVVEAVVEETVNTNEVEATEEVEVTVSSAEDDDTVINEDGIHIEDESTEDDDDDSDEVEVDDSSDEIQNEIVEEDPTDVEADIVDESDDAEEKTPNLADIINEAIEEETNDVIEAVDSIDDIDPDADLIMETAKQINEERERAAKKSSKKKYDPNFYGNKRSRKEASEDE